MTLFDDLFETGAQGAIELTFAQQVRLVSGTTKSDWFSARRIEATNPGEAGERVPEIGEFYLWECVVADVVRGATPMVPQVGQSIETEDFDGNAILYSICADADEPAVIFVDNQKRYHIRTQRVGS